jgi:hypothetical protein
VILAVLDRVLGEGTVSLIFGLVAVGVQITLIPANDLFHISGGNGYIETEFALIIQVFDVLFTLHIQFMINLPLDIHRMMLLSSGYPIG